GLVAHPPSRQGGGVGTHALGVGRAVARPSLLRPARLRRPRRRRRVHPAAVARPRHLLRWDTALVVSRGTRGRLSRRWRAEAVGSLVAREGLPVSHPTDATTQTRIGGLQHALNRPLPANPPPSSPPARRGCATPPQRGRSQSSMPSPV